MNVDISSLLELNTYHVGIKESEASLKRRVLLKLNKYFFIEEEIRGTHFTGKTVIIDAIIKPRSSIEWANESIVFGIEFKREDYGVSNRKGVTKIMAQSLDYAQSTFGGYGLINVLMCPSPGEQHLRDSGLPILMSFLARYGVGEIAVDTGHGLSIYMGPDLVWSEHRGVVTGKKQKFARIFGAR